MMTLLLIIIYISFVSLGLPDSLLGSSWPVISATLHVPVAFGGILSMITTAGTVVSSLLSSRLIRRFGTGVVTAVSVGMTAAALFGYSLSHSFWILCLLAVPLGLGAGCVDAALNNFVSLHYKALHMNWLHCFWGIGATAGPYILSVTLMQPNGWQTGYRTVSLIQICLVVILFATLFLWKRAERRDGRAAETGNAAKPLSFAATLKLPNAKEALAVFFCYCAIEATTGLWAASFLVLSRCVTPVTAAQWVSLYYLAITVGRFFSGIVSIRIDNRNMVRIGIALIAVGVLMLLIASSPAFMIAGMILAGLGCAPIYPSLLHDTPRRFGKENAQSLMGIQMASAYIGTSVVPPLFGLIAGWLTPAPLPVYILLFVAGMAFFSERMNRSESIGEVANPHK